MTTSPPINLTIVDLMKYMCDNNASDIYVTVGCPPMFRIEGLTGPWGDKILSDEDAMRLTLSTMSEEQKKEFLEKFEMNLAMANDMGRFRVNAFRQMGKVGLVIRQIKTKISTIDDLKLPQILKKIIMAKRGLIMVVGGTGSGKSTSLAAMLDHRNANAPGHIISIEDPVEFVHQHKKSVITQREVGMDTLSFRAALKNTLRQAPDVILIGEVRDSETMEMAIEFAETGHLCLCTLHANNANQAIERVMNFFAHERHAQFYMQLSLNLKSIISQRLVRGVGGKRCAAIEILLDSPRIKDLMLKGEIKQIKEAMEKSEDDGMQTFDGALYKLWRDKLISTDDALANADSANNLRLRMKVENLGSEESEGSGTKLSL